MRVLHIDTGREMRGGQHQVMLLLNELRRAGHESVLLARPDGELRRAAEAGGFSVYPATLPSVWRYSSGVAIVHAHDARGHTLAAIAARRKLVVSRRVAFPVKRGVASRWKYSRAARFLAVSHFVAGQLEKSGVRREIIDIVFDGIDLEGHMGVASQASWNSQFPAVALGSADPQKGRDLVDRAAHLAGIPIVFSTDLERDFQRASMFVYITRSEGLGSAALLAMRMGVPVIASRVGGLPEVIEDGKSGILVQNDSTQLASVMQSLQADPARALAFIEQGRRRIADLFSGRHLVQRTLASYGRAIAG
ncbi:MAG TPA: glycosyltransferase family 4 protein [Bryobacteraceae bacterium]|nr:glycosyltransferase family 4 protein [Bryobacteraceae bacterium]